jgi:uncharacterized membrane protein YphA (DoxX/SURF4 family)
MRSRVTASAGALLAPRRERDRSRCGSYPPRTVENTCQIREASPPCRPFTRNRREIAILNWHEIVNDRVGERPVAVTYCALCGTGVAFEALHAGRRLDFTACPTARQTKPNTIQLDEDRPMITLARRLQGVLDTSRALDFLAPLALRLYLAPVFWMAGTKKLADFDSTVQWFGNPDWGLGLPFPALLAFLAAGAETLGAILLVLGLGVRWISVPLMITMVVAAATVHWQNGWLAIAEGTGSLFANDRTIGAIERLDRAKDILREHGNYGWLTENGSLVILNNGIEFAATYFIMLLALFSIGAGRYLSLDFWLARHFARAAYQRSGGARFRGGRAAATTRVS